MAKKNKQPNDTTRPPRAKRRNFPASERARILFAYDTAENSLQRATILRQEGVYASLLAAWRKSLARINPDDPKAFDAQQRGRPVKDFLLVENSRLKETVERLEKRCEHSESLLDTLGKVHALLQTAAGKSATEKQQFKKP